MATAGLPTPTARVTNNYKKEGRITQSKPGDVASGCLGDCLPFTMASVAIIAVKTFDLISDWLAYHTLQRKELTKYIAQLASGINDTNNTPTPSSFESHMKSLISQLSNILLGLCITATLVFALEIVRFSYMFCAQRRIFMDKRDGVPYKSSLVEKYGGEILTLMQCLTQNLSMSLIYFLVQVAVSCDFLVSLQDPVLLLAYSATMLSLVCKVCEVFWAWGCFGYRDAYINGWLVGCLRGVTLIFVACALVTTSLNLLLASPSTSISQKLLDNPIFDKVGIERWMQEDFIILKEEPFAKSSHANGKKHRDRTSKYSRVMRVSDILHAWEDVLTVIQPYDSDFNNEAHPPLWMVNLQKSNENLSNCSLVYLFQYHTTKQTVFYNFGYKCFDHEGTCVSDTLTDSSDAPSVHLTSHLPFDLPDLFGDESAESDSEERFPTEVPNEYLGSQLQYSNKTSDHWVKCSLQLVVNSTLLPFSPCSYSPLDQ